MSFSRSMVACAAVILSLMPGVPPAQAKMLSWPEIAAWPDLEGGNWSYVGVRNGSLIPMALQMPLKPAIMAVMRTKFDAQGRPKWNVGLPGYISTGTCEPQGVPAYLGTQFFYSRAGIFMVGVTDYDTVDRRIYMDGRGHGDPDPTYYGNSIGHWEGDTLVIDTVGFLPDVEIGFGVVGQGKQEIIERYRLTGKGTAELRLTIIDPAVLTRPYTKSIQMVMTDDDDTQELFCTNNRDSTGTVDLTPPQ